jgi:hypothetical protein
MTMTDKAMRITEGKGFHLDLPNGVTVSVQFGPMNYCDQDARNAEFNAPAKAAANGEFWSSNLAECAAYLTGSNLSWVGVPGFTGPIGDEDVETFYDDVCGYMTVQEVLDFINRASQLVNPEANEKSLGNKILASLEEGDDVLPGQQEFDFDETR